MSNPTSAAAVSLTTFEEKYELWRSWCSLSPSEPNSIDRQLISLISNDLEFRVIEKARALGNTTLDNLLLRNCLGVGYATTQLIGIRRLTDSDNTRKHGVIALARLSCEIKSHIACFTRRNYICHGGFAYEVDLPFSVEGADSSGFVTPLSPMDLWIRNQARHKQFDLISSTHPQERMPDDQLDSRLLEEAFRCLNDESIGKLRKRVNKFVAHAADAISREEVSARSISLDLIASAHKLLIRAESILVDFLLFAEVARDATFHPPLHGFHELAGCDSNKARQLRAEWDRLAAERESWRISKQEVAALLS